MHLPLFTKKCGLGFSHFFRSSFLVAFSLLDADLLLNSFSRLYHNLSLIGKELRKAKLEPSPLSKMFGEESFDVQTFTNRKLFCHRLKPLADKVKCLNIS